MNLPTLKWKRYHWTHISSPSQEMLEWLGKTYNFHDLDLEDSIAEKTQRPKWEKYKDHSFFVFHFASLDSQGKIKIQEMKAFIGKNFLITIAANQMPVTDWFKNTLENPVKHELLNGTPGLLLYNLIDKLTDRGLLNVRRLGSMLDGLNKRMEELDRNAIKDASQMRRNLIIYITTLKPMINIFNQLEETSVMYLNGKLSPYWGSISDHLQQISDTLTDYGELLDGLYEAYDILLTKRTNETISFLTVFSVLMLPLSLIASIYGMNVNLPLANSSSTFSIIMGIMAMILITMIASFKWKKWV